MKVSKLISTLLFSSVCATASAGTMTLYQSDTPFTVSTNSDNVVAAESFATTGSDILVSLTFTFSGSIDRNDFLALWFGYDSLGTSDDKNILGAHTSGPNIGIKGNADSISNPLDLFVRNSGTSGSWLLGSAIEPGTPYQLFAHLYKSEGSSTYDQFDAWLNPTVEEVESLNAATADATATSNSGISLLNMFGFRSANLDGGDSVLVSNLTIQAIPEPATAALASVALLGLAALARKNRA